jgi:hypothetical protein
MHPGLVISGDYEFEENKYYKRNQDGTYSLLKEKDNTLQYVYTNDNSGILYSNMLYRVDIIIKSSYKDYNNTILSQSSEKNTRWLWTNNMFNRHYYTVPDYDVLQPELTFDSYVTYAPIEDKWIWEKIEDYNDTATIDHLSQVSNEPNVEMKVKCGL